MQVFSPLDIFGVLCFVGAWVAYAVMVERTRHGRRTLNARIDR